MSLASRLLARHHVNESAADKIIELLNSNDNRERIGKSVLNREGKEIPGTVVLDSDAVLYKKGDKTFIYSVDEFNNEVQKVELTANAVNTLKSIL